LVIEIQCAGYCKKAVRKNGLVDGKLTEKFYTQWMTVKEYT
jgi:hypothetical protein